MFLLCAAVTIWTYLSGCIRILFRSDIWWKPTSICTNTNSRQSSSCATFHLLAGIEMNSNCKQCSEPIKTIEFIQCSGFCHQSAHLKCCNLFLLLDCCGELSLLAHTGSLWVPIAMPINTRVPVRYYHVKPSHWYNTHNRTLSSDRSLSSVGRSRRMPQMYAPLGACCSCLHTTTKSTSPKHTLPYHPILPRGDLP